MSTGKQGRGPSPEALRKMDKVNKDYHQRQRQSQAKVDKKLEVMPPIERHDEVKRITDAIMKELGSCNLEAGLTVVCGIGGQLIARLSEGNLTTAKKMSTGLGENICHAAYAKLMHDQAIKRQETKT